MLDHEDAVERVRQDHGLVEAAMESRRVEQVAGRFGTTSFRQGYRSGWWDAVSWLLNTQTHAPDLTDAEWLGEIRKGRGSVYWPVFAADPTFKADCPTCGFQRLFDAEGVCPDCGWEMT